ncbi:hypothetical protein GCM10019059_36120 [Camelimonas fluminis]|uniref:CobQ/CobB/MinD/ParA family nucleotide binding protein n=1 Tax=Camelimonas fluminis TaxID=1576911 RepID=A0ABV7UHL2_9HYPH|nr:hypothetical protein [Camelimonas fluminis]GHE73313.1 hypothetical protein GCM10019059_36120 [Camelimonas fluminis]
MADSTILVGNRTGGQGKTLLTQLIHYGYTLEKVDLKVAAADTDAASADGFKSSKLGSILRDVEVEELGIGAGLNAVQSNQHVAVQYWDRLGELLLEGGWVVDLGANVIPMVFQWAAARKAGKLLSENAPMLVVPVTAQPQSLSDALGVFQNAARVAENLPFSEKVMVLNEYHGAFDENAREFKTIRELGRVRIVTVKRANVEIWEKIESRRFSIERLLNMSVQDYVREFGVSVFAASGSLSALTDWVMESLDALQAAGVVPKGNGVTDTAAAGAQKIAG